MALPFIMRNQYLACFKFCATSELNVVQVILLQFPHSKIMVLSRKSAHLLFCLGSKFTQINVHPGASIA